MLPAPTMSRPPSLSGATCRLLPSPVAYYPRPPPPGLRAFPRWITPRPATATAQLTRRAHLGDPRTPRHRWLRRSGLGLGLSRGPDAELDHVKLRHERVCRRRHPQRRRVRRRACWREDRRRTPLSRRRRVGLQGARRAAIDARRADLCLIDVASRGLADYAERGVGGARASSRR